ncbi:cation diffusion facilitator family transporter [Natranaerovirga hydrolytica]|uniref:Cation diffusion facilitator family transporter n=1 Tax=Natranaerovirga hydrolytica TaxID=680378 RepID=A0A4R1ML86_9FIRM|nr:cation diffusion facilitator family transporter [Natranaerovirga hydrolytica]TCK92840.1 cation diffusion facilitator family transporter [Natranaerovirga hydrolytica]
MKKSKEVSLVAILGIIANAFLVFAKLLIGFSTRSQAMIADGLNSAGDVFTSVLTFIGNKLASQPKDSDHPFGHGKAEYIFSLIISLSLFFVSFAIISNSFDSIINQEAFTFSFWLIIVSIITIIIKILLFIFSKKVGRKYDSLLAIANAEDHRNDVFLTAGTLLSIIMGIYNIYWVDGLVGMMIALWIAYTGFEIFSSSYQVLMDTTLDPKIEKDIKADIINIHGIDHIDSILSKPVGLEFILIVKVSVNASLTVLEGHSLAAQVKDKLLNYEHITDVIVHVNPCE